MDPHLKPAEDRANAKAWHEDAFNCVRCPEAGCPFWWTFEWETDNGDGVLRSRAFAGCGAALSQGLFAKMLAGQAIERAASDQRTGEILDNQKGQAEGVKAILRGILHIAAKQAGPAALAVEPLVPKIVAAVRRMLPGKKGRA